MENCSFCLLLSQINDDLRFLIENNSTMVEGLVKKQYDEFAVTVHLLIELVTTSQFMYN